MGRYNITMQTHIYRIFHHPNAGNVFLSKIFKDVNLLFSIKQHKKNEEEEEILGISVIQHI